MKTNTVTRNSSLTFIYLWLGILVFIPLVLMLITSFLQHSEDKLILWHFTFKNYTTLAQWVYLRILWQSLEISLSVTLICLIVGYPAAYIISNLTPRSKTLALLFMILPFWTSSLIRTYAIVAVLKTQGLLNTLLLALGVINHPLQLLYSYPAVLIGNVYNLLPFMILPLYANIDKLDKRLLEAGRDLGANRIRLFTRIILPLTMPGVVAGSLLVFLPAMTLFFIPVLLGGAKDLLVGNLIQDQFLSMHNWPGGSATSLLLTLLMLILIGIYRHVATGPQREELLV